MDKIKCSIPRLFLAAVAMMLSGSVWSQSENPCPQWKNPTSFNTGSTDCYWTARVGERVSGSDGSSGDKVMSTCSDPSATAIVGHNNIVSSDLNTGSDAGITCCSHKDVWDAADKRFMILTLADTGIDEFTIPKSGDGGMPRIPPGYTSCIRLGDPRASYCYESPSTNKWKKSHCNKSSEALFYTMYVTPENALLFINYAVVGRCYDHTPSAAGEFLIRVVKQNDDESWPNEPINDSLWFRVSAPAIPSGKPPAPWEMGMPGSSCASTTCAYVYKPWAKVAISLNSFLYSNVRVEIYTSDCVPTVDPIYAYVCGDYAPMIIGSSGCPSPESDVIDTLTAPKDMLSYQWFAADRGAVKQEYLFNYIYMDTVAFHPISDVLTDSLAFRYNASLTDFVIQTGPNKGDTASTQTFMCVMTSAMDPDKPFSSKIYANVENRRPLVDHYFETECDGTVHLYNRTTCFSAAGIEDDSTHWVVYADPTATVPLDTIWGSNVDYQFAATGDYAVKLFATTAGNESASPCTAAETFVVHAKKNPPSDFEASKHILCEGEELHLVASDQVKALGTQIKLTWVIDGDTLTETGAEVHKVLPVGTHNISLTTMNADSCHTTSTDQVLYMGQPIISLGSNINEICEGDSVTLSADGTIDYTWNSAPADPNLDTAQHGAVVVYPTQTTTYYLVPAGNSPCKIETASVKIEVVPTPVPTVRSSSPRVNKEDPTLTLLDVSNDAYYSHWSFSDGGTAEGQRVEHSFTTLDVDSVYVTLQSCNRLNCCADTTLAFPVEVTTVWFANVFTPDRDDNNRFGMVTSLTLLEYEIYVYNRNGQLVWTTTDPDEQWDGMMPDGKKAPQGTYAYYCRYSYNPDTYHTCKGSVTLIR